MENSVQEASDSGSQEIEEVIDTEMENSAQDAPYGVQEAPDSGSQEIEEAIDTEMSALSVTGVREDESMSRPLLCPVQCEDQENMLYDELVVKMPYIIDGIENGEIILVHKNSSGNLEVVGLRSLNCDVYSANTVVESSSADENRGNLNDVFTHIRFLKACKCLKGVASDSSKLCLGYGEYREKFEYDVVAELGNGLYGEVERIFDTGKLTKFARKKIPILDFCEEEVLALNDLSGTGVSPDLYGLLIEGNHVYIFMEEITNAVPLSRLIPRIQKSEHRAQIALHLLYDLLVALFKIHSKWWLHNDLHEDNIVMQVKQDVIKQDVSIRSRILDLGEASYTEEDKDFRKEYEQVGKLCKDMLISISEEESELDKSARRKIQVLMKKVSNITQFRQLIQKVQLPRYVEKALQEICLDAAGFKAANSNKDRTSNFKAYMEYSTSGGSTASEEPLTEQDVFKWLDEHPDSFKKYLANREINSVPESNHQDPAMSKVHEKLGKVEQQKHPVFHDFSSDHSHTDSKVFMMRAVRGSIHQASTLTFNHEAAGTQCTAICAIAAAVAAFKQPSEWSKDDVDKIIRIGDSVHVCELKKRGWPSKRKESRLGVDELPKKIEFDVESEIIQVNIDVTDRTSYRLISQIELLVKDAVNNNPDQSFILRMLDRCRAILYNENGCYSVFDPHSCDEFGHTDPNGVACVLHFDNIDGLVNHLKNLVTNQDCHNENQVDLTTCNITIQVSGPPEDIVFGDTINDNH